MMNKVVEDYILSEKLGQGQYGNVYKAENKKNKKLFAVKVMSA
jgi:serine/threonine protein kinase